MRRNDKYIFVHLAGFFFCVSGRTFMTNNIFCQNTRKYFFKNLAFIAKTDRIFATDTLKLLENKYQI